MGAPIQEGNLPEELWICPVDAAEYNRATIKLRKTHWDKICSGCTLGKFRKRSCDGPKRYVLADKE